MTDEELVKRAREAYPATQDMNHTAQGALLDELADRIEALTAERDRLTAIGTEMAESIEGNYYLPGVVRRWFIALSGESHE